MSSTSSRAVEGADGIVSPDSYLIEHVKFHNNAGKVVDIKSFIQKIELIEDLNHPFIEGVIFTKDPIDPGIAPLIRIRLSSRSILATSKL